MVGSTAAFTASLVASQRKDDFRVFDHTQTEQLYDGTMAAHQNNLPTQDGVMVFNEVAIPITVSC